MPILQGDKINQSDYKQFLGMSKEIVDFRSDNNEEALWTNSMFGGMPAYQISVHYPNNILVQIDKALQLFLPRPIGIIFLYFIGFYILLLSLRLNPHFAFLGALAFGLSTYLFIIIEVGHNTKAHAISYIAPSLAGMIHCFRKENTSLTKMIFGFFLSFLFLGLHLRGNHLQITYYFLFIIFAFWINYMIRAVKLGQIANFIRSTSVFCTAGLLAILINIGSIWSTYEYSKYTTRGMSELKPKSTNQTSGLDKDYATSYSYGMLETFNLLYPNFKGGSSVGKLSEKSSVYEALRTNGISKRDSKSFLEAVPLYFGPQQFTAGPVYIGAVVWLLFFIGFFTLKKPIKWILVVLTLFSFILAWGKYFPLITNLFLDYFPLYNKFRTVSMILVIAEFTVPLLGVLGIYNLWKLDINLSEKKYIVLKSSGLLILSSVFFLLFGNLIFDFQSISDAQFPNWFTKALIKDRVLMYKSDILRSMMFIAIGTGIIYFAIIKSKKQNFKWVYALSILIFLDLWFINKRYFNHSSFVDKNIVEIPFQMQDFDRIIKQDTSIYRVYNLNERLDQGARTSYFHHSLGGYHGAKLGKYQELIDSHISKGNLNVINMLNTKYIITSNQNREPIVQKNESACGNAWFVQQANWVNSADLELMSLNDFEPEKSVIINKKHQTYVGDFSFDKDNIIELTSYRPNKLIYRTQVNTRSLAVFSEIFYPKGWNAYLDGVLVDHIPVNYLLRALMIPEGTSEIVFEFKPKSFFISSKISFVLSCLLILSAIISFLRLFAKKT
ncbi:MAG: hypothetical protein CBD51_004305 [Flavobacteriales bacterium TMED191]|nr:MAG: hypothetical protein CBD51_004305 [Flavobacteriales bacterium TMED191]